MTSPLACPHCEAPIFRQSPDGLKLRVRTSVLVLHKSGEVEINCPSCSHGVLVPLVAAPGPVMLKKAIETRLIARRA